MALALPEAPELPCGSLPRGSVARPRWGAAAASASLPLRSLPSTGRWGLAGAVGWVTARSPTPALTGSSGPQVLPTWMSPSSCAPVLWVLMGRGGGSSVLPYPDSQLTQQWCGRGFESGSPNSLRGCSGLALASSPPASRALPRPEPALAPCRPVRPGWASCSAIKEDFGMVTPGFTLVPVKLAWPEPVQRRRGP